MLENISAIESEIILDYVVKRLEDEFGTVPGLEVRGDNLTVKSGRALFDVTMFWSALDKVEKEYVVTCQYGCSGTTSCLNREGSCIDVQNLNTYHDYESIGDWVCEEFAEWIAWMK